MYVELQNFILRDFHFGTMFVTPLNQSFNA